MIHDKLCYLGSEKAHAYQMDSYELCDCDLIARVREDERMGSTTGIIYMAAAQMNELLNTSRRDGYAAALRNAVKAVKVLQGVGDRAGVGSTIGRLRAVAAIEALGGESDGA